ncbi:MAG: hypothetical protein AB7F43_04700 [Bacteriovoracia bacterium]
MLVSGFTIIRNGIEYDFPYLESIRSLLPLCDEFIVNVGKSSDQTLKTIQDFKESLPFGKKNHFHIFETEWPLDDPEKRQGGHILADQTNLALDRCKGRWCFYLQADEVLHENDLPLIRAQLLDWQNRPEIEAVVLNYIHFYGTYSVIQTSRSSYRREIRVVRNGLGIRSTGDAQSFLHADGRKIGAVLSSGRVFHYGWVRPQEKMKEKTAFMDTLYHPEASTESPETGDNYKYKRIVGIRPFRGTHPQVMKGRISAALENGPSGVFDFTKAPRVFKLKDVWKVVSGGIESLTGIRPFEYKNYRLIK